MSARSLNRVQLIGNLTRDPELRYTPQGTAVCTFGLATNRSWTTDGGEKKEETEFHRIVSWNKLAELCSQLLVKGRKIYVEGRLSTRTWTGQDGNQRTTTEVVIDDMILLDSRRPETVEGAAVKADESLSVEVGEAPPAESPVVPAQSVSQTASVKTPARGKTKKAESEAVEESDVVTEVKESEEDKINPDDIPF
ncbi:MAG: single-stranded DNA-binding protein [bacterium]|nr:single-stranded DNA-binding protein [bacterium]